MAHIKNRNLLLGAAVVGVLSTLAKLMLPKAKQEKWAQQAKEVANNVLNEWTNWKGPQQEAKNKNFLMGGVAGGLVGLATALLLAPKSGKDLIQEIVDRLQNGRTKSSHRARAPHRETRKATPVIQHQAAASRIRRNSSKGPATKRRASTSAKRTASRRAKGHETAEHGHGHTEKAE